MPYNQLKNQFPILSEFLGEHFHKDVFYENEHAVTLNDLLNDVVYSLFISSEEPEPAQVKELREELEQFIETLAYDSYKSRFIVDFVQIDLGDLNPLEFLMYLHLRIKVEINERKNFAGEGDEE